MGRVRTIIDVADLADRARRYVQSHQDQVTRARHEQHERERHLVVALSRIVRCPYGCGEWVTLATKSANGRRRYRGSVTAHKCPQTLGADE